MKMKALKVFVLLLFGCSSQQSHRYETLRAKFHDARAISPRPSRTGGESGEARDPALAPDGSGRVKPPGLFEPDPSSAAPFGTQADSGPVLAPEALMAAVVRQNPSLEAARAAWRASLSAYPQATALPDPQLGYFLAPGSIGSSEVSFGQMVSLSQAFPWPGRLSAAGDAALFYAAAIGEDFRAAKLSLATRAAQLAYEDFALARGIQLNDEHLRQVSLLLETTRAAYSTGRGGQADALAAELELGHVRHRHHELMAQRSRVRIQINGLLHRSPDAKLPPAPSTLRSEWLSLAPPPSLRSLTAVGHQERPGLASAKQTVFGRHADLDAAEAQSYPDFMLGGEYNSMWHEPAHQWMVGVSVNLPVQLGSRAAARDQARARIKEAEAGHSAAVDAMGVEIAEARTQVLEYQHVLSLFRQDIIPTARARVRAERAAYESGQGGFERLISVEREVLRLELHQVEAEAQLALAWTALAQACGLLPTLRGVSMLRAAGAGSEGLEPQASMSRRRR